MRGWQRQNEMLFMRGNAISAPIMIGTIQWQSRDQAGYDKEDHGSGRGRVTHCTCACRLDGRVPSNP